MKRHCVVLAAGVWLAAGGISESKTYYKTIAELGQMGDEAWNKRLRVAGYVEDGSIVRTGREVRFILQQENLKLRVVYEGVEPLPDTFRGGVQAVADGKMGRDGAFHASRIQAKCSSKYEAKPGPRAPRHEPAAS